MNKIREIYRANQLPIFQNRMYDSEKEAKNCPKGDIQLIEYSCRQDLFIMPLFAPNCYDMTVTTRTSKR